MLKRKTFSGGFLRGFSLSIVGAITGTLTQVQQWQE